MGKLPVVYLQPLKPRFVLFTRETKKEADCYPNSNTDLDTQCRHCRWSMSLRTIPSSQKAHFNASSLLTPYVTSDSFFKAPSFITAICFQPPAAPLAAGTVLTGLPAFPLTQGVQLSPVHRTHLNTEQQCQRELQRQLRTGH